jgi:hypothetical protein
VASRSKAARCSMRLAVQNPPESCMSVPCEWWVLSSRGLCVGLITRPEQPNTVWPLSLENDSWPTRGYCAIKILNASHSVRFNHYSSKLVNLWTLICHHFLLTKRTCPYCATHVIIYRVSSNSNWNNINVYVEAISQPTMTLLCNTFLGKLPNFVCNRQLISFTFFLLVLLSISENWLRDSYMKHVHKNKRKTSIHVLCYITLDVPENIVITSPQMMITINNRNIPK